MKSLMCPKCGCEFKAAQSMGTCDECLYEDATYFGGISKSCSIELAMASGILENRDDVNGQRWIEYLLKKNPGIATEIVTNEYETNSTLLHKAAYGRYLKIIEMLVKAGADINYKDEKGQTPVDVGIFWCFDNKSKIAKLKKAFGV